MVGRWTKGLLHLLVGGACAALVAWLAFGFSQTVVNTHGAVRVGMVVVVVLAVVLVGALLTAPPVRPAAVALARTLLDLPLDDPTDTSSWEARSRGLVWAVAVIVLGGTSLLALLWCLPQGVWLAVAAFSERASADLPAGLDAVPAPALLVLGVLVAVAGVAVQPVLVVALRALAPATLGPTPGDVLAAQEARRRELLRANELARELHDSVGHALTAIGVQAEAGVRVADLDPAFARTALERIAETTRRAVGELDGVLGTLREASPDPGDRGVPGGPAPGTRDPAGLGDPAGPGGPADLEGVVELLGEVGPLGSGEVVVEEGAGVGATAARTAYRVVQEALTNAQRHGSGPVRGAVQVRGATLVVVLENPVADGGPAATGGRGLVGMRERVELLDGSLEAGPVEVDGEPWWRVEARLPAREEPS